MTKAQIRGGNLTPNVFEDSCPFKSFPKTLNLPETKPKKFFENTKLYIPSLPDFKILLTTRE